MATSDKYDRQLRLWGSHGQRALMNANILLVNADAAGSETLKNLVLPGVGRFSILDNVLVDDVDIGSNFFVHLSDRGRPRAEVCVAYLTEMNADVVGTSIVQDVATFDFDAALPQFSLVVLSNPTDSLLIRTSRSCWQLRIPVIAITSIGFLCTYRVQLRDHDVIESKIDQSQRGLDLCIARPFAGLLQLCAQFSLDELDAASHGHVPYIVILRKTLERWRSQHDGGDPKTFADKEAFKALVRSQALDLVNEVNFEEALSKAYQAYAHEGLSDEVLEIVQHMRQVPLGADCGEFTLLVKALDAFLVASGGEPPISGVVPDMTSSTELFIQLQSVYQTKALEDRVAFKTLLQRIALASGAPPVDDDRVEVFCRNCRNLRFVSTSSIDEQLFGPPSSSVRSAVFDPYAAANQTPILWYVAIRALEKFREKFQRYPGTIDDLTTADADALWNDMQELAEAMEIPVAETAEDKMEISDESPSAESPCAVSRLLAEELVRCADSQLHSISAFIGGVASQEIVKLLTHQFVPLNNYFIYNGIASCGAVYSV